MNKEETVAKVGTETLNIVNDMLRSLMVEAGKLKDFAVDQLPDVVQQFLQWRFYEHLIYFIVALLILVVWIVVDVYAFEFIKKTKDPENLLIGYVVIGSVIRGIIIVLIANIINLKWLQILIAPKVYLLEYAASLVK